MALQIRRGTAAQRTSVTPAEGELLYTTDTKLVYVGDGSTAGGNIISGGGISDIVNDTSPQLGGDLDVNGFSLISAGNNNININPAGTGNVVLQGSLEINSSGNIQKTGEFNISPTTVTSFGSNSEGIDGNVYIVRNTYSGSATAGLVFAQHHSTPDAVNLNFFRSRGTGTSPTAVLSGDDIADIAFTGWDGTQRFPAGNISVKVDGAVSTGIIPGKMEFFVHDGITAGLSGVKLRAEIKPDGRFRIDQLAALTSTNIVVPTNNTIDIGDVRLSQSGLSTVNSNANLFLTANANGRVYIDGSGWPASLGTAGQVLSTDGAGSLSWTNAPGYIARTTASGSTGNIADAATANVSITGFKTYSLLKIESTHAAWIRLYVSAAARTADASRAEGVDPAPGAGVIAEIVTTGSQTILMSPGVFGWNNESPVTTNIACAVTNKSGSTANISITCTLVQLEA